MMWALILTVCLPIGADNRECGVIASVERWATYADCNAAWREVADAEIERITKTGWGPMLIERATCLNLGAST